MHALQQRVLGPSLSHTHGRARGRPEDCSQRKRSDDRTKCLECCKEGAMTQGSQWPLKAGEGRKDSP